MTRDFCILDVLLKLAPTLNWLNEVQPYNAVDIPAEHQWGFKQLETMGLAYRRNSRTCGLQNQRLLKMLKRELQFATADKQGQCLAAFSLILEVEDKLDPADLALPGNAALQLA